MVDVSDKATRAREAVAEGFVRMTPETLKVALSGEGRKGDVRAVAEIAGVMAAKRTSDLIPMCHPLALSMVEVRVEPADGLRERDRLGRQRRDLRQHPGAGVVDGKKLHATQWPLLPPVFETSRIPSMTMPFSAAFSMS
jgi:hypothetical protein